MKNTKSRTGVLLATIIVLITLLSGCRWAIGPFGDTGLYLEDSDGGRYFSGSKIFIGNAPDPGAGSSTRTITLQFVNSTGQTIRFKSSPVFELEEHYEISNNGVLNMGSSTDISTDLSAISEGDELLDFDKSGSISFTITSGGNWMWNHRRYRVQVEGDSEEWDFVFEVYGYSDGS